MAYTPGNPGAMPGVAPLASAPAPLSTAPVGGAPPPGQGTTFAPILTLARALANYAQQPQRTTILENQASSDAAAREQAAAIQGYMTALAHTLQGIAPAVQTGYTQAAGLDALLGKGFGNQLAGQGPADQAATQSLANISGAPQGQVDAVNAVTPNAGLGNALGWLNGGLPAQGLNQAGAAFGAAARMLPATAAGQGLEQIQNVQGRQQLADQGFQQKLGDLAAQYPGLLLKTETGLEGQFKPTTFGSSTAGYSSLDPLTGQVTQLTKGTGAIPKIFGSSASGYSSIDPSTGKVTQLTQPTPGKPSYYNDAFGRRIQVKPDGTQTVISAGKYTDPSTGAIMQVGINGKVTALTGGKPAKAAAAHYTTISDATGQYIVNEATGEKRYVGGPKPTSATKPRYESRPDGVYRISPNGTATRVKGIPRTAAAKKAASGGVTATRARTLKLSGTAETVAQHAYTGFTDAKGTTHPAIGYAAAYEEMLKEGIPKRMALAALNRAYPPGQRETQLNPDATGPPAP